MVFFKKGLKTLFLIALTLPTFAFALADGQISTDRLNVRKIPNGNVIEQLNTGHPVEIVREQDGWMQIIYFNENPDIPSHGWVSSRFVELQMKIEGQSCATNPADQSEYCLSTMKPELQCSINNDTASYQSCSIDIRYEISRNTGNLNDVGISCSAEIKSRESYIGTWYNASQSASTIHSAQDKSTLSKNLELVFEFGPQPPVVEVKVANSECQLAFNS